MRHIHFLGNFGLKHDDWFSNWTKTDENAIMSSVNTTTTTSVGKPEGSTATSSSNHSHGSYKMAMENIIEDYGRRYVCFTQGPLKW